MSMEIIKKSIQNGNLKFVYLWKKENCNLIFNKLVHEAN